MSVPAVAHAPPTTRARVGSAVNSMLIGLMGIVFGLGIMYLLSRVMQTSRRVAVVERQLKQHQIKTDDVDVQLNYLLIKAAQPPQPPPPVVRHVDTVAAAAAAPKPPTIPFPGNVTLVDMSPDMLMPPGFMNLFCGFMDEMEGANASVKAGGRVEEVVEEEAPVAAAQVPAEEIKPVEKQEDKKSELFIDGGSDSSSSSSSSGGGSSSDNDDDQVAPAPPPRRGAGRGGGRGRGKKV